MTTWIYGAVHLNTSAVSVKENIIRYWSLLSDAYNVSIGLEHPYMENLEPDIAELWKGNSWIKFYIKGDFFVAAAEHAARIYKEEQKGLTILDVWPRVPEWRCLQMMLSHECITKLYFIVEDASGDSADVEQVRNKSLSNMLTELWSQYVYHSSEDAALYQVDYSITPM